jgi:uncharacterized cupredoxin-like copper-binding protein
VLCGDRRLIAGVLGASLLLSGCTSDAAATVEIAIHYSRFQPDLITVPAGRPIRFVLSNQDPIDHEWIVGDDDVHERHRTGTEPSHGARPTEQSVPALGSVRTTVTFERAGTYRFICHLPGHEAYGMVGTLTVRGG